MKINSGLNKTVFYFYHFQDYWIIIAFIYIFLSFSNNHGESKIMAPISDNQIIVILLSVFVTGILALRLGKELYQ